MAGEADLVADPGVGLDDPGVGRVREDLAAKEGAMCRQVAARASERPPILSGERNGECPLWVISCRDG